MAAYFDGVRWTGHLRPLPASGAAPAEHPTLDLRIALGAVVVLAASLVGSKYLLDWLVRYDWPIAVFTGISIAVGYGPSMAWWWYASSRWGSGHPARDAGLRFRWSDAGWGPLTWLAAIGCQLAAVVVIQLTGIPLVGNTEGIAELDEDRTYVISLLTAAVVAAPIVEEIVFRGLILRGLRSRMGGPPAVAVQGIVFGLAHVDPVRGWGNLGLALALACVGAAFGGAAYLLGRIGPTIVAHAVFNAVVMTVVLTR